MQRKVNDLLMPPKQAASEEKAEQIHAHIYIYRGAAAPLREARPRRGGAAAPLREGARGMVNDCIL